LLVQTEQQDPLANFQLQDGSQIINGGCLSDAAFLVGNSNDSEHNLILSCEDSLCANCTTLPGKVQGLFAFLLRVCRAMKKPIQPDPLASTFTKSRISRNSVIFFLTKYFEYCRIARTESFDQNILSGGRGLTKLYSIRDLAIETGVSYHTVYYYLRRNLIKEIGIIGEDQRIFDEASLNRLRVILVLRESGKSISEIKSILAEKE
jgi:hypothetical protein